MYNTLVYGYGVSGKSAVALLLAKGERVAVYDKRKDVLLPSSVLDCRGKDYAEILSSIKEIVVSPSVNPETDHLLRHARVLGIPIIAEIELAYRYCPCRIITVTGTNGKTTTVRLIAEMLERYGIDARAVGNIGNGFCSEVLTMTKESVAVVEASSFQLSTIDCYKSDIALCLNVSPDHMEYHGSMANYIMAKSNVYNGMKMNDKLHATKKTRESSKERIAIINSDDESVVNMCRDITAKKLHFSQKGKVKGVYCLDGRVYCNITNEEYISNVADWSLMGEHNIENVLAAVTVAKVFGVEDRIIRDVLVTFEPSPYRLAIVGDYHGKRYYNDSKSTNISSTLSACRTMSGSTALIMGGYDKGLDYKDMFCMLSAFDIRVIAFGANRKKVVKDISESGIEYTLADSLDKAVDIAINMAVDNVLFSPATSSYDVFDNYIERGRYYDKILQEKLGF